MTATNFYLLLVVISDYAMNVCYASPSVAGFTGGIFIIGSCIARILIGKEMNRFGYRRSLCMGIILSVVMSLSYFVATNIPVLLIIRFLHGMAFGISTTVSSTIVADMLPGDRIGEGIGYYCLSQTFATAIGPFLALFLTKSGNFNMIFAVSALAAVISLVLIPIIHIPGQEVLEKATGIHTKFNLNNLLEVNVIPLSLVALLIFYAILP
jgi:MFS family permease